MSFLYTHTYSGLVMHHRDPEQVYMYARWALRHAPRLHQIQCDPSILPQTQIFHLSLYEGHAILMHHLIDCEGMSANHVFPEGLSPLFLASQQAHSDCVEVLLNSGAELGFRNRWGWTALHGATWYGHTPIVKYVLLTYASASNRNFHLGNLSHS